VTNEYDTVAETINGDKYSTHYNINRDGRYNGAKLEDALAETRYDELGRLESGICLN